MPGDYILSWRGVIRLARDLLEERIKPSELNGLSKILKPTEIEDICNKEREGKRAHAVKDLIDKLLGLKGPETWPDLFLTALDDNYSHIAIALTDTYQKLKKDIFADVTITLTSKHGKLDKV